MKTFIRVQTLLMLTSLAVLCQDSECEGTPAFPGAQGGGAQSVGGRGGRIIEVTNLNGSGPGSLREACAAIGPRTVVFRIGGTIEIDRRIWIVEPYITIAGQTAPGGGILIKGHQVSVATHDVSIRYLRVRTGRNDNFHHQEGDCIALHGNCENVIVDHCSASWSNDENIQVWADDVPSFNITFSNNLIAEGLLYDHLSCGLIVGSDNDANSMINIDIHMNLFMSNYKRNPLVKGKSSRVINNLIYNWESNTSMFGGGIDIDIIGNLYKPGPNTGTTEMKHWIDEGVSGSPSIYMHGNKSPRQPDVNGDAWNMIEQGDANNHNWGTPPDRQECQRSVPMPPNVFPITVRNLKETERIILEDAGASSRLDQYGNWVKNRDAVDLRLVQEYKDGTGQIPIDESEVGGYPVISAGVPYPDADHDGMSDVWEKKNGLDPANPSDGVEDADGDGYTNVEEFLNGTLTLE